MGVFIEIEKTYFDRQNPWVQIVVFVALFNELDKLLACVKV